MFDSIPALLDPPDTDGVHIKAWSYRRLKQFEQCPKRAKLMFVDQVPEPKRELKPGQTEFANDRGTRVHKAAEDHVRNGIELIPELSSFTAEFDRLRQLYGQGRVSLEGDWAFNDAWQPCDWFAPETWTRVKLDAMVMLTDEHAVVVDYKTGRKAGNEVDHADQMQLYQLATLLRNPAITKVTVELWYLDQDELTRTVYTRDQGLKHLRRWNERGMKITQAETFPPRANQYTCRFCPYGPRGSGVCEEGV